MLEKLLIDELLNFANEMPFFDFQTFHDELSNMRDPETYYEQGVTFDLDDVWSMAAFRGRSGNQQKAVKPVTLIRAAAIKAQKMFHAQRTFVAPSLKSITSDSRCMCAYRAYAPRSTWQVYVVQWRASEPGPISLCDGLPVVYVNAFYQEERALDLQFTYNEDPYNSCRRHIQGIIDRHGSVLMQAHSNLIWIRVGHYQDCCSVIVFGVPCKGFIPVSDVAPLPKVLEGVPCVVVSARAEGACSYFT